MPRQGHFKNGARGKALYHWVNGTDDEGVQSAELFLATRLSFERTWENEVFI